ncbi:MAG: alpha/beta hydrolase, partial [Mariprofundus sp.]
RVGGSDYYGRIMRTLSDAGGYTLSAPGKANPQHQARVYVFLYDWRQDLTKSAAELDHFIDQIRSDYSMPQLKVDIVAHSMGSLVTRYFLRYGSIDVLAMQHPQPTLDGMSKVRKVIMLGAPNLGSVSGLQQFLMGFKVGMGHISTDVLATMPSSYQLLPHPDRDWMVNPDGSRDSRNLYDAQNSCTIYCLRW